MNYGSKQYAKTINNERKYFTKEILDKIDEHTEKKFLRNRRLKDMSLHKDLMMTILA